MTTGRNGKLDARRKSYPTSNGNSLLLEEQSIISRGDTDDLLDPNLINGFHNQPEKTNSITNSQTIKTTTNGAINVANGDTPMATNSLSDSLKLLNPPHLSYRPVTMLDTVERRSRSPNFSDSRKSSHGGVLKAVKDYESSKFSRSGHPRLELSFREGDVLKPLGEKCLMIPRFLFLHILFKFCFKCMGFTSPFCIFKVSKYMYLMLYCL